MANWEKKSSYLLREIVKFRTYIDCLQAAEVGKQKIYKERAERKKAEHAYLSAKQPTEIWKEELEALRKAILHRDGQRQHQERDREPSAEAEDPGPGSKRSVKKKKKKPTGILSILNNYENFYCS